MLQSHDAAFLDMIYHIAQNHDLYTLDADNERIPNILGHISDQDDTI